MRPTQALQLRPQPARPGMGQLSLGASTEIEVPGVLLAAQFRCAAGYLALTTQDSPFEETLHISLFDEGLHLLDAIDLGQAYTGACLEQLELLDDERLRFTFFSGDRWELRLRARPSLGGAPLPQPARRTRMFWRPRHLDLQLLVPPPGDTP